MVRHGRSRQSCQLPGALLQWGTRGTPVLSLENIVLSPGAPKPDVGYWGCWALHHIAPPAMLGESGEGCAGQSSPIPL